MNLIEIFLKEMAQEAETTRKFLALLPEDKYDWRPHPKSMSIRQLATHIAELPSWVQITLTTDELDFNANPYQLPEILDNTSMLAYFEENLKKGNDALLIATEKDLLPLWTMRAGDDIYTVNPKHEVIRLALSQTTHHRAQLGVFLRLLNIPIPGSYGPTADEMEMMTQSA